MKNTALWNESKFPFLPDRYRRENPPERIGRHLDLFESMKKRGTILAAAPTASPRVFSLAVCTRDRPGLFYHIAGALFLHRLDVLEARAYTWANHVALDRFFVRLSLEDWLDDFDWQAPENTLRQALLGRMDLEHAVEQRMASLPRPGSARLARPHAPQVRVHSQPVDGSTLVEVEAADAPGILFLLARSLAKSHVAIQGAQVRTRGLGIRDQFWVRTPAELPLTDPAQQRRVAQNLEAVLKPAV